MYSSNLDYLGLLVHPFLRKCLHFLSNPIPGFQEEYESMLNEDVYYLIYICNLMGLTKKHFYCIFYCMSLQRGRRDICKSWIQWIWWEETALWVCLQVWLSILFFGDFWRFSSINFFLKLWKLIVTTPWIREKKTGVMR
jgi:hypothetical protein